MQTKEQQRSKFALEQVEKVFRIPEKADLVVDKETANFVVGVPTMILTNGLGQTLAFILSKEDQKKPYFAKTFQVIRDWLVKQKRPNLDATEKLGFLKQIAALDQKEYLWAQQETLCLLQWLKRYVRAFQDPASKEPQR